MNNNMLFNPIDKSKITLSSTNSNLYPNLNNQNIFFLNEKNRQDNFESVNDKPKNFLSKDENSKENNEDKEMKDGCQVLNSKILTDMIASNHFNIPKNFENVVEDYFSQQNICFSNFDQVITELTPEPLKNNFVLLNPDFCVYSNLHQKLFVLTPLRKRNSNNNLDYYMCIFEPNKFLKKIKLKFEEEPNSDIGHHNKQYSLRIEKLILNTKNENQMCLFSRNGIAIISDMNKIIDVISNEYTIYTILRNEHLKIFYQEDNNYQQKDEIFFYKFLFWHFENHFGIYTSDKFFKIFYINDYGNFELIIDFNPEQTLKNYHNINLVDFDFGCNIESSIWENFAIFFLDVSGQIFYCCPVFPKKINTQILMPFRKMKNFISLLKHVRMDNYDKSLNSLDQKKNFSNIFSSSKNQKVDDTDQIGNDNIINILIDLQNKRKLEKEKFIVSDNVSKEKLTSNKACNDPHNVDFEINKYLNFFNEPQNIYLKKIFINDKRKSSDKLKSHSSILDLYDPMMKCAKLNKNISKYTKILVLSTFPIAVIRVFQEEILDVIIINDEIKPIRNEDCLNDIGNEINAFLVESKCIKINHPPISPVMNIKVNPLNNTQLILNILSDVYIIYLKFLDQLNKKFCISKCLDDGKEENKINRCIGIITTSELIPLIKIDYLKLKNLNAKKFSFIGLNFINLFGNKELNQNKNFFNNNNCSRNIFAVGFDINNQIFCKEYKSYLSIEEIISDKKYSQNKNKEFNEFISISNNQEELEKLSVKIQLRKRLNPISSNIDNSNLLKQMFFLKSETIEKIFEEDLLKDFIIKKPIKGMENIMDSSLFEFDIFLNRDLKIIYENYLNRIQQFSNENLNKINFFDRATSSLKTLDFIKRLKQIKIITTKIDESIKAIHQKRIFIENKFTLIKTAINKVLSVDKKTLIGQINCHDYFTNKNNFVKTLLRQFEELKIYLQALNEKSVILFNIKLAFIKIDYLDDDKIRNMATFTSNMFQFLNQTKKQIETITIIN